MSRPSFDEYVMRLVDAVRVRGTCSRRQVGAVAIDAEGSVIATGYNGALRKARHCNHEAYSRPEDDPDLYQIDGRWSCHRAIHSETNLVYYAARNGMVLQGSTVYCDTFPCLNCLKAMIGAGVKASVFLDDYQNDRRVAELCSETGFVLRRYVR